MYICLLWNMPTVSFICRLVFILDFCHTYFRLIFPMCYLSPCLYIPCVCFFLSSSYTLFLLLIRKLPWLSRQSDRLLTDRSLVRSQAEAPFFLFLLLNQSISPAFYFLQKSTPPVGLEPTTARLRAARYTDWARKATNERLWTALFYQYYLTVYDIWYIIYESVCMRERLFERLNERKTMWLCI